MVKEWIKELPFQWLAAAVSALTVSVVFALLAMEDSGSFFQAYLFYLVFTAPVFLVLGAPISAAIRRSTRSYLVSLFAYAVAGAAAMYVYLAVVMSGLQLHMSRDVWSFLLIGAGASLYMYHVSLALSRWRKPKL